MGPNRRLSAGCVGALKMSVLAEEMILTAKIDESIRIAYPAAPHRE